MDVSTPLKDRPKHTAFQWCQETRTFSEFLAGVIGVIQPELYAIGCEALSKLAEAPLPDEQHWVPDEGVSRLHDILPHWGHPWNAMSVMVNRTTPCHTDGLGIDNFMDLLVTVGEYSLGRLEVPGLGVRFVYDAGSAVAILARVLKHGVAEVNGERACLAYYMRSLVANRLDLPEGGWTNVDQLSPVE